MNRRDFLTATGAATAFGLAPRLIAASKADHTLRIGPVSAEIAKGKTILTTGYNGSIPGPMLRMKEGKPVTIDIFNETNSPELVHWHGLNVSTKADGAEEEGSPYVMPHSQLRVSFTPKPAGNRWYHTHVMAMDDVTKGAYSGQFGFLYIPGRMIRSTSSRHVIGNLASCTAAIPRTIGRWTTPAQLSVRTASATGNPCA
jgi:FtsP/CotA-like multicopper oxidase with cupredoxin domain